MLHKSRQFNNRSKVTQSNRLPNIRSRHFLLNQLRQIRLVRTSGALRAALGLTVWTLTEPRKKLHVAFRSSCLLSARSRGNLRRFGIARTKVRTLSEQGKLFGVRKAS